MVFHTFRPQKMPTKSPYWNFHAWYPHSMKWSMIFIQYISITTHAIHEIPLYSVISKKKHWIPKNIRYDPMKHYSIPWFSVKYPWYSVTSYFIPIEFHNSPLDPYDIPTGFCHFSIFFQAAKRAQQQLQEVPSGGSHEKTGASMVISMGFSCDAHGMLDSLVSCDADQLLIQCEILWNGVFVWRC